MFDLDLDIVDRLALDGLDKAQDDVLEALSETLTAIAFKARKRVWVPQTKSRFTLRNSFLLNKRSPGGLSVDISTPATLTASVRYGPKAPFTELHQFGGTRLPPSGDFEFFIPGGKLRGKRVKRDPIVRAARTGRGITGPMPKGLSRTRAGRTFFAPVDAQNRGKGWRIVRRVPGKEPGERLTKRGTIRKRQRRAIETLGFMESRARFRKRLDVAEETVALADREAATIFQRKLIEAMKRSGMS